MTPFNEMFKVVSLSENTNSFGLTGMLIVNTKGRTYSVAANSLNVKNQDDIFAVPTTVLADGTISYNFASLGFEIPERKTDCPEKILKLIWK